MDRFWASCLRGRYYGDLCEEGFQKCTYARTDPSVWLFLRGVCTVAWSSTNDDLCEK